MEDKQIQGIVAGFLSPRGITSFEIERLFGGGNNRAYRVDTVEGSHFLKLYHQDPEDPRRRGATEFQWLEALWNSGIREMPEPLGFQETKDFSAGLYEYIPGTPIRPGDLNETVTPALVKQAADFVLRINAARNHPQALSLSAASEACFSIKDHLTTIERRVRALQQINGDENAVSKEAAHFVTNVLWPQWEKNRLNPPAGSDQSLPQWERVLSPSDFGFHNAILTKENRIRFIDFEYAGWDDPAKLICDFFNQVQIAVPFEYSPLLINELSKLSSQPEELAARVRFLYPLYRVKWACILLNHFLPAGARRKKFSLQNTVEWEILLQNQLHKALKLFAD